MMAINTNQIQAMLEQLRATADMVTPPSAKIHNLNNRMVDSPDRGSAAGKVDFAAALKETLDRVNDLQVRSEVMGQQFAIGDDSVQLSDVMISMQKASIALQTTVQARNRIVSAYQEIMSMQV